ncbi:MAG: SufD family Fe-S cluster assembly protein [Candidatus Eremiobacteraeota bacterium]|nr:SufD family Fe-S cluster assembly protein [Candidatus Eremiobacteraeota bacterium]
MKARGEGSISTQDRYDALARFQEMPARSVAKPGRSWKHDLAKVDFSATSFDLGCEAPLVLEHAGLAIEDFHHARERRPAEFERAFGKALDTRDDKFASLALAFNCGGIFVAVPDGAALDEPLVVGYEVAGPSTFPYTLVHVGARARVTIVEQLLGDADDGFICGLTELVLEDGAELTYVVDQRIAGRSRALFTRRAVLGKDAKLSFCAAELGAEHSVHRLRVLEAGTGAQTEVAALFFTRGNQHVEVESETIHAAKATQSRTVVRSAGIERGQGRYFGNIKILANAHGADASLRDDALLLSEDARVDSIPALEIAANDVKAFHGATVGSISEDELFYAQSRGITRTDAERMIALGFFEPALSRFPGDALRTELRETLAGKFEPSL